MVGAGMRAAAATAGRARIGGPRGYRCASVRPARSSCRYSELVIQRVLAPNPGPMTLTGTNTWLVGDGSGQLAVIDPGPDDAQHVAAILEAAEPLGRIAAVLVTHRHVDHLPAAQMICARTGAPLAGHADLPGVQRPLADGEPAFGGLRAL